MQAEGGDRFAGTAKKALAINLDPKWCAEGAWGVWTGCRGSAGGGAAGVGAPSHKRAVGGRRAAEGTPPHPLPPSPPRYGVFAEIGAGQEVARWFFRVGAAAGTIAKSVSAYDMTISDTMYGAAARYVTRERVEAMLEYEYLSCSLNLRKQARAWRGGGVGGRSPTPRRSPTPFVVPQRGDSTAFFAFADTVVARAFGRDNECHGWLGVKFQPDPNAEPATVMLHVRMHDATAQEQQEALGVLGVNLVHGVLTHGADTRAVISGLLHDLNRSRASVDLIDFAGPLYAATDNRVAALRLVQQELCDAALFDPSGTLLVPHDALRKKNVLAVRGRFRPFTNLHNDMLIAAAQQFFCGKPAEGGGGGAPVPPPQAFADGATQAYDAECVYRADTIVLLEMTTRDMMEVGRGGGEKSGVVGARRPRVRRHPRPRPPSPGRRPARLDVQFGHPGGRVRAAGGGAVDDGLHG